MKFTKSKYGQVTNRLNLFEKLLSMNLSLSITRRITRMIGARRRLPEEVLESRAEKIMEILEKHTDVREAVSVIERTMAP